jgi:hypothetical protein
MEARPGAMARSAKQRFIGTHRWRLRLDILQFARRLMAMDNR